MATDTASSMENSARSLDVVRSQGAKIALGMMAIATVVLPLAALAIAPSRAVIAAGVLAAATALVFFNMRGAERLVSSVRQTISALMMMVPVVAVFVFAGHPWQLDMHMSFYAVLAISALFCDWRAVIAGAAVVAVHHIGLNFALPQYVFPDGTDFLRVILHAAILVAQASALVVLCYRLAKTLDESDARVRDLGEKMEENRRLVEAQALADQRLNEQRAEQDRQAQAAREKARREQQEQAARAHEAELERARLEQEHRVEEEKSRQAAAERAANLERARVMERMSTAFLSVVQAAGRGDFSQRVTESFEDSHLDGLADAFNTLLKTVDEGISQSAVVLDAVAGADLTRRVTGHHQGVYGRLAEGVNATASQLERIILDLQGAASSLSRSTGELGGGAEELSQRAARQTEVLRDAKEAVSKLAQEMKSHIHEMEVARKAVAEIGERVGEGHAAMDQASSAMTKIEESSAQVAEILGTIDTISFQTTLLSLNASVEAARAGEAGKGFAVVAEEIRKLATTTSEASTSIRTLVDRSGVDVGEGVSRITTAQEQMKETVDAMEGLAGRIGNVTEASKEQSYQLSGVLDVMVELDQLSNQNASLAGETRSASMKTADLAKSFQMTCGKFVVGRGQGAVGRRAA